MFSTDQKFHKLKEKIIIVDFGSQVTKLIARRIREFSVLSLIVTPEKFRKIKDFSKIKGIILSGGPSSVTKRKFPKINRKIFEKKIPILGICFGLQLIAKNLGGKVKSLKKTREFGNSILKKKKNSPLTKNFFKTKYVNVWMSHQDAVTKMPSNFQLLASTKDSNFTIISNEKKKIYGIQFHPEVTHTENGKKIIKNFIFDICKIKKNWKINFEVKRLVNNIKEETKNKLVLCALSGGVDSSVVALLINKAIKKRLI